MTPRPPGAVRRPEPLREISYGGLVLRPEPGGGQGVLVIVPRGTRALALPKGGAALGETPEQTAAREVREETGTRVVVREPIGEVSYRYRRRGRKVSKTVFFFLCDYESGSTDDHDHEVEDARWIPLAEAPRRLTYEGERELAARALARGAGGAMPTG